MPDDQFLTKLKDSKFGREIFAADEKSAQERRRALSTELETETRRVENVFQESDKVIEPAIKRAAAARAALDAALTEIYNSDVRRQNASWALYHARNKIEHELRQNAHPTIAAARIWIGETQESDRGNSAVSTHINRGISRAFHNLPSMQERSAYFRNARARLDELELLVDQNLVPALIDDLKKKLPVLIMTEANPGYRR